MLMHSEPSATSTRENAVIRAASTQGPSEKSVPRRPSLQVPPAADLVSLLWRHSAAIVLAAPLTSPLPLTVLQPGRPTPPGDGWGGSGGGGGGGGSSAERLSNEILQLAVALKPVTLTLASFAVTRKAYSKIVRKFAHEYEASTGRPVRFRLAFGGSGTQARAVIDGLPADIVALALPLDILKIEEAGLINPGWGARFPNKAIICESVVSIVTRMGNPKNIRGWEDLARDDIKVVVANPKTAGVARWIFLALWGHKMGAGEVAAGRFVTKVFDNVEVMPRDAREASDVFYSQGFGDALLTYENEAVFTNLVVSPQAPLPFISPDNNVRITCPGALVDRNIEVSGPPELRDATKEAANAFVSYLFTAPAQREFVACGFRSVNKEAFEGVEVPRVKRLWEVEKRMGDWTAVQKKFFDEGGILSDIMADVSKRKLAQRLAERGRRR